MGLEARKRDRQLGIPFQMAVGEFPPIGKCGFGAAAHDALLGAKTSCTRVGNFLEILAFFDRLRNRRLARPMASHFEEDGARLAA